VFFFQVDFKTFLAFCLKFLSSILRREKQCHQLPFKSLGFSVVSWRFSVSLCNYDCFSEFIFWKVSLEILQRNLRRMWTTCFTLVLSTVVSLQQYITRDIWTEEFLHCKNDVISVPINHNFGDSEYFERLFN
jgi:hypothetical protein